MSQILNSLSDEQIQAITHTEGSLLILAGAGSGKTKTLTTRLAYLIDEIGVPAQNTLTLTFTNKASLEMQKRALSLLNHSLSIPPLLCTFHRFGLMFLKLYIHILDRKNNFTLLDSTDKKNLLKSIEQRLPIPISYLNESISLFKNSLIDPQTAYREASHSKEKQEIARIYEIYCQKLLHQNLIDFDDLLFLPYKILNEDGNLCETLSLKYNYIMVDEYQDTNLLQFKLLQKLCIKHENLCVVGDDDQSIYSWRGADIHNILDFKKHFPGARIVKLETNYRSKQEVLNIANQLISHNTQRIGKTLCSSIGKGGVVKLLHFKDNQEESRQIAKKILELKQEGIIPSEIAILFRLNALSRSLEEGLNSFNVPYKLIGTIRFYERAEIKDILSYLRYITNPKDDYSLSRIINNPRRGIGTTTQDILFNLAEKTNQSVYTLFSQNSYDSILSKKILYKLGDFFETIQYLRTLISSPLLLLEELFKQTGILQSYGQSDEAINRIANIEEFSAAMNDFFFKNPSSSLEDFLDTLPLHSDLDSMEDEECIRALSIHTAKGLEFECVFVLGMENGFFPLLHDGSDIEEERRLAYVAFTRAKSKLFISHSDSRFYKGKQAYLSPSQFLKESGLLQSKKSVSSSYAQKQNLVKGDLVSHKIFGTGRVKEMRENNIVIVDFGGLIKNILIEFLQKI